MYCVPILVSRYLQNAYVPKNKTLAKSDLRKGCPVNVLPRSRHSTFQEGPESKTASDVASMALALQLSTRIRKQCKAEIVQYSSVCVCVCVIHKESMQQSIYTLKIIKDICQLLPFQAVHVVLYPRNTDLFEIELVQSRKTCPAASESVSVYVPTPVDHSDHSNNSD